MKIRSTRCSEHRSLAQRDMGALQASSSKLPALGFCASCAAIALVSVAMGKRQPAKSE